MAEAALSVTQFLDRSQYINSQIAEIEAELRAKSESIGEPFPELEAFAELHLETQKCRLCGRRVQTAPRWHFEGRHYDEFLQWLESRAVCF